MPPSWHFDTSTFWVLAAIALAEGLRRVPAGGVLLRRVPGYPWQVGAGPYRASAWRLTSAFSPLALHVLLQRADAAPRPMPGRGAIRLWIALLRVPSLLALIALVVGVPLLTASMATRGLILAVAAALGTSLLTAILAMLALVRMGIGWKTAAGDALRIVSPFTSPRAPEIVLERVLAGVPVIDAARALLPPGAFAAWIRPLAYDAVMRGADDGLVPRGEAERIIRQPPADAAPGDAWCPRCAGVYQPGVEACRGCGDVPLERAMPSTVPVATLPEPAGAAGVR
ncbi:MAG TPA: hypothetical protein VEQ60_10565 [Longimicrobium sp.]|nr:hypothetical protein [Longimicrobium sp.]